MTKQKNDIAPYLFNQGTTCKAYEYLGAHSEKVGDKAVTVFRVWAPNADKVSLCGDFSDWESGIPMER